MPRQGLGNAAVASVATEEQLARFGHLWASMAITEPECGSDSAAIRTTARLDGDHYVLNGEKIYVTAGERSQAVVVWATLDRSLGRAAIKSFLVEKGTPGFTVERLEDKLGIRASDTAALRLVDVRVPRENLLGSPEVHPERGFGGVMQTFDNTRPLVAAMAIGIGRAAYDYACDFVKENYALQRHTPRYAAIAERLARVGQRLEAARLLTWRAAYLADEEQPNAKEASMSKAAAGQASIAACIEAIEICGAEGSISKDHQLLEKWFRDIKVYDIFEGTGAIQRIVISKRLITDLKSF